MQVELRLDKNMRILGDNGRGHITVFDTSAKVGGDDSAATPMEVLLQAMAACSFMDVSSILRKKRKTITGLTIKITGERKEEHPKMFNMAHLIYELDSPDAELKDLDRAVELSQSKYCGASAMFKEAGCLVTWDTKVNKVEKEEVDN